MIKVRIHIWEDVHIFNEQVYIDTVMFRPKIGERVFLTNNQILKLNNMAKKSNSKDYYEDDFGIQNEINFESAETVIEVIHVIEEPFIRVLLHKQQL